MRTRLLGPLVGAATLVALLCVPAHAGVNVEIDPNATVSGSLDGAGDSDTFRFDCTAGASLTLTVKAKKKARLDLTLELTVEGGAPVDLTAGKAFQDRDKSIKVKGIVLEENARYVLRVGGAGEGEYSLKLKSKAQKSFSGRRSVPGTDAVPFEFSAPRGAKVVIKVKRPKDSTAAPMLNGGSIKGTTSSLTLSSLDEGGLQQVSVSNTADAAGDLDITVKVTPARAKPEKVDVRAAALGDPTDGGTAVSTTVDAVNGGEVVVPFQGTAIAGAGVLVPAGALAVDVRISVSSAAVVATPDPQTQRSTGPAVRFGPDGLQFSEDATVTIPWDPSAFPVGVDPVTDLRVIRVQSDGTEQVIVPLTVDVENGLCTVPTSGFSTFMAFAPRGTPNLEGESYWVATHGFCMNEDSLFNADSREREIFFFAGVADFGAPNVPGGVTLEGIESVVSLTHDTVGDAIVSSSEDSSFSETGDWFYHSGGQSIGLILDSSEGPDPSAFYIAEDGSALISQEQDDLTDPCVYLDVAVRRSAAAPTVAEVAGVYHLGGGEVRVSENPGGSGPAAMSLASSNGSLTLRANGTWTAKLSLHSQRIDPQGRTQSEKSSRTISGSFRIAGTAGLAVLEGSILLNDGQDDVLRILPSADRQTLLAFSENVDEGGMYYVGTRVASGLSMAQVQGAFAVRVLLPEGFAPYSIFDGQGNVDAPDFAALGSVDQLFSLESDGHAEFVDGVAKFVSRDPLVGPGGVRIESFRGFTFENEFNVSANGKLITKGEDLVVGAFSDDGVFAFWVEDPQRVSQPTLNVAVRLPPFNGGRELLPPTKR